MDAAHRSRFGLMLSQWYGRKVIEKTLLGQTLRKLRRFYLGNFKREYIANSIKTSRKGECHRCGACCELIYRCPFLGRDSQNLPYCRVYGDLRPANCSNYPFDAIDSEVEQCGFKFKKEIS